MPLAMITIDVPMIYSPVIAIFLAFVVIFIAVRVLLRYIPFLG